MYDTSCNFFKFQSTLLIPMQQARALGASLADVPFAVIYSSSLKRASMTAAALHEAQPAPQPPFIISPLLREQHFGVAEGKPWGYSISGTKMDDPYSHLLHGFPEGESQNDLHNRAERFVKEDLVPHFRQTSREKIPDMHVAIVSHGLFIHELIAALFELEAPASTRPLTARRGLRNTGWIRVHVHAQVISVTVVFANALS
jgi:broad specificity phosphatase PhoE